MSRQSNSLSLSAIILVLFCLQVSQVNGISGGCQTMRSDWPFVAAIIMPDFGYFCGGTLISDKHVLTAAHCVQSKGTNNQILPNKIIVRLGAYNITANDEEGALDRNVTHIHIHSDWKVYEERYDADLAVLVLDEKIEFTSFVQAVSLPADDVVIDGKTIDVNGTIVSWGLAEKRTPEDIRRQARVHAFDNSDCLLENPALVFVSSKRTFCAGNGNGTVKRGDGGSGFFVDSSSGWIQYGIISAILTDGIGRVNANYPGVYTNVKSFKTWINDILKMN